MQHFVWPGITFAWQAQHYTDGVENRKTHWYVARQLCTQLSMKEVSQNCFVFDVVNFENWGRLADMFRFWCCQVKKWRTSRRIVSFLTLTSSKIEDASKNCFVFDVVKFKKLRSLAELLPFQACRLQIGQIDGQLQLQLPLRYTTTTTTNANKLRYTCTTLTTLITSNYTTQVKISMFQTMSFQNASWTQHAPTSRNLSPQLN